MTDEVKEAWPPYTLGEDVRIDPEEARSAIAYLSGYLGDYGIPNGLKESHLTKEHMVDTIRKQIDRCMIKRK